MKKAKFNFVLVVWASMAFVLFSPAASSGNDTDFSPAEIAEGWQAETFLLVPYLTGAMAFDTEDNLYATNLVEEYSGENITVYKYAAPEYDFSNPSIYASYPKTLDTTSGIDFDEKRNLFVSEIIQSDNPSGYEYENAGLIRKVRAGNLKISDPIIFINIPNVPGNGDFRPTGVAATGKETLYFPGRQWSEPEWGNIYKIDSFKEYVQGTEPSIVRADLVMYAIADDKWGHIFVADRSIWTRNPYTNDTVEIARFLSPKYVEEMAFDSEGNLYALEGDDNPGPYEVEILKIVPPHIIISGCDTGIIDWPMQDGSTLGGLIDDGCSDNPSSHGNFVSCIVSYAVDCMKEGLISPQQLTSIITCAAQADIPNAPHRTDSD